MLAFPPDDVIAPAYALVSALSGVTTTTIAIALFVTAIRVLLHPLARAAARGRQAQARLAPELKRIHDRYRNDPERLRRAMAALYRDRGTSPLAGMLPGLLQVPAFMIMYRLFSAAELGGRPNELLGHTLFGAPLGGRWLDAPFGAEGMVFLALFALIAVVAVWTSRWTARHAPAEGPLGALLRLLPYGTLIAAAFLPLATGVYLLTVSVLSAVERSLLQRRFGPGTQAPLRQRA